jgi:2-dehydro-3-deoxyphosphogluconate aldolase / (4S)-4-hydroxy-2-oxoglutarate aldolase
MNVRLVEWCMKNDVPVFPGCATPTEIMLALEAGLNTVKFFPAEQLGGVRMLSTLGSVFQTVQFMPTGGITSDNLASYLAIKQVVACGGSWMVLPQWIRNNQFSKIHDEIKRVVALLH